jgi:hypothetical protein
MGKIDNRLDSGDQRFAAVEKNMAQRDEVLQQIQQQISKLPCHGENCPVEPHRKR